MIRFIRRLKVFLTTAVILLLILEPIHALRDRRLFYGEDYENKLSLVLTGDLMMHATQYLSSEDPQDPSRYNFKPWFHYMMGLFSSADFVIGNFETTITENPAHYSGYPMFRSPHAIARDLNYAGFNVMVMANNHSLDNGLYGVETSLNHLRSTNILTTGTYLRDETPLPLILEKNGLRIGIINATYGTNGIPLPRNYPHVVNLLNEETIDRQLTYLKESTVDGILCFVHWGDEYQRSPNAYQKRWTTYLNEKGVDWVIGAHPHAIQPEAYLENSNGHKTYVNYSLGNMISNQRWRYSDTGLALTLDIERIDGALVYKVTHHPFWVDKEDEYGKVSYTMLPLKTHYPLARLSPKDISLMKEALADFYELYPNAKTITP